MCLSRKRRQSACKQMWRSSWCAKRAKAHRNAWTPLWSEASFALTERASHAPKGQSSARAVSGIRRILSFATARGELETLTSGGDGERHLGGGQ